MNHNSNTTTPIKITREISLFCTEIDPTTKPTYVPVLPRKEVRFNYCLTDVPDFVKSYGGVIQFGWIIWECPQVFLVAEFHACWVNHENIIIDIVPKPDNEKRVLFLPDSKRLYDHKPVPNRLKALVDNDYTKLWLKIENKTDEIKSKHFVNDEFDSAAIETELNEWLSSLAPPSNLKIGRNEPCFCGSGLKYKKCCGN